MAKYHLGQPITLSVVVEVAGVRTAPGGITLRVEKPDGTVDTYLVGTLTNPSTGYYTKVYSPATAGNYGYSWTTTGTGEGYIEAFFRVQAHEVAT